MYVSASLYSLTSTLILITSKLTYQIQTPLSQAPQSLIRASGLAYAWYMAGKVTLDGLLLNHLHFQNIVMFPAPTLLEMLEANHSSLAWFFLPICLIPFHQVEAFLIPFKHVPHKVWFWKLPYLKVRIPLKITSPSSNILHFNFKSNAMLKDSMFMTPNPPPSLGLQIILHFIQFIPLLYSLPCKRNKLYIRIISLMIFFGINVLNFLP